MRVLTLDFESTGIDVHEDRIVTCFLGLLEDSGQFIAERTWIINPGIPIPDGAAAVHGWTTERVLANPTTRHDVAVALDEIDSIIRHECRGNGVPLVAFNAAYDLSLLHAELRRHLRRGLDLTGVSVLDPLVIDKAVDRYRKGSRKLVHVAQHYGLDVDESRAHDAGYDCWLAGSVALRQLQLPRFQATPPVVLHESQVFWKAEQSASLEDYFRKQGKPETVDRGWPLHSAYAA